MSDYMKKLAKKKAKIEVESDEPKVKAYGDDWPVRQRESGRQGQREVEFAKEQGMMDRPSDEYPLGRKDETDLDDHETRSKAVLQRRKFGMLNSLLGHFDEMDK